MTVQLFQEQAERQKRELEQPQEDTMSEEKKPVKRRQANTEKKPQEAMPVAPAPTPEEMDKGLAEAIAYCEEWIANQRKIDKFDWDPNDARKYEKMQVRLAKLRGE